METRIKKNFLGKRPFSLLLSFLTIVLLFLPMPEKVTAAGERPGTQAYYDARWEEAKIAAGYKEVGTAYRDYSGANVTTTNGGPWNLNLDWGNTCSLPWNGMAIAPTTTTTITNVAGASLVAYEVYTAEQLRWCIAGHQSFKLMNDIDLNGYTGKTWSEPDVAVNFWVADGNGHTIFNYYSNGDIFGDTSNFDIKNLRVKNSYLSTRIAGRAFFVTNGSNLNIYKCSIEDSLVYSFFRSSVTYEWGNAGFAKSITNGCIESCYTDNLHIYQYSNADLSCSAIILFGGIDCRIYNTFCVNGSIIGNKGHSGGFASCIYGATTIENCFTSNIDVYGNRAAGSFIGVLHDGTFNITNCFASGKVEGVRELGGFIGALEPYDPYVPLDINASLENCYTTSLVGVQRTSVERSGGFIGVLQTLNYNESTNTVAKNCYATGEVGSSSTNSFDNRGLTDATIAGFLGDRHGNTTYNFKKCYFDAQMTGMRNISLGHTGYTPEVCVSDYLQENFPTTLDIKSVLTSDSDKCGTGLTSAPSSNGVGTSGTTEVNRSFTGFTDNSQWTFTEGYYPQLEVFTNPTTFTNTNWMTQTEMNDLVKACSLASVSTAKLNTWDKDYQGNDLPKDTYDTVRDVVSAAPLTNEANISWSRCGVTGEDTLATGSGAKTDIFGSTRDVVTLEKNATSGWQVKDPYPGVDWLRARATVGGQTASRAFRLSPTMGLSAGAPSKVVETKTLYDHADDMKMVYSTGARYAADKSDMTYGVYPDVPLATGQDQVLSTGGLQNKTALTNLYGQVGQNDMYSNINVGNMQRSSTDINSYPAATTSSGNKLNTNIKKGSTNVDLNGIMGQKFNGNLNFANSDVGDYTITYDWSLNDGRYITGSKNIKVPAPATKTVTVKKFVTAGNWATLTGNETFSFTVRIKDPSGKSYKPNGSYETRYGNGNASKYTVYSTGQDTATTSLGNNDSLILPNIPEDYSVEIIESDLDGYITTNKVGSGASNTGRTVNINNIQSDQEVTYTNIKQAETKTLNIFKEVPNAPTGFAESFDFTLDITKGSTRFIPADGTYKIYEGSNLVSRTINKDANGRLTFKLGNGERLEVTGITEGFTAKVEEAENNKYVTSYSTDLGVSSKTGRSATVTMNEDQIIMYTNEIAVRDLTIKKTLIGTSTDTFSFAIKPKDASILNRIPDDSNNPARYTKTNDSIVFDLKGGQEVKIASIPVGSELTLTETSHDGFTTAIYDITSGRSLLANGDSADITLSETKTIEVINNSGLELPASGGPGNWIYILIGAGIISTALAVGIYAKKRIVDARK